MRIDPDRDPSDDRTDEEVIAEHKQWVSELGWKPAPMSAEDQEKWDAVAAKMRAEKNHHVHPVMRQLIKRF